MKIGPKIWFKTVLFIFRVLCFCFFGPLVIFWSSEILFIQSSGFGLRTQLVNLELQILLQCISQNFLHNIQFYPRFGRGGKRRLRGYPTPYPAQEGPSREGP